MFVEAKTRGPVGPSFDDLHNPTFFVYNDGHDKPSFINMMFLLCFSHKRDCIVRE